MGHHAEVADEAAPVRTHPYLHSGTLSAGYSGQLCASGSRQWRGNTKQAPRGTSLLPSHPWGRLVAPAQAGIVLAKPVSAVYSSHSWLWLHVGNTIAILCRINNTWERKEITILMQSKCSQPGSLIFCILRGLTGALSVKLELLPGLSLRGTHTQTWINLTHAAAFRNGSDILPLPHHGC